VVPERGYTRLERGILWDRLGRAAAVRLGKMSLEV
jgi:hypothetical protein